MCRPPFENSETYFLEETGPLELNHGRPLCYWAGASDQNLMVVDVREGGQNCRFFFPGRHKWMTPNKNQQLARINRCFQEVRQQNHQRNTGIPIFHLLYFLRLNIIIIDQTSLGQMLIGTFFIYSY